MELVPPASFKVTCQLEFHHAVLFKLSPQGVKLLLR